MKPIAWRIQLEVIASAYAGILLMGTFWFYQRHLQELSDPQAAMASSGMWAFGDLILVVFLYLLCLIPTFFLLRLMRTNEVVYDNYAKIVLAVSLTSPLCLAALSFHVGENIAVLENFFALRLFNSPLVFGLMVMSRLFARQRPAKRLINWSMLTEVATLVGALAIALLQDKPHG